ncbi:MAG: response regulator, partial [Gaiellaceae bacterium]
MRILVVDDDAAVREALRRALGLERYEVELAGDGAEALKRLGGEPDVDAAEIDAMVLDVSM